MKSLHIGIMSPDSKFPPYSPPDDDRELEEMTSGSLQGVSGAGDAGSGGNTESSKGNGGKAPAPGEENAPGSLGGQAASKEEDTGYLAGDLGRPDVDYKPATETRGVEEGAAEPARKNPAEANGDLDGIDSATEEAATSVSKADEGLGAPAPSATQIPEAQNADPQSSGLESLLQVSDKADYGIYKDPRTMTEALMEETKLPRETLSPISHAIHGMSRVTVNKVVLLIDRSLSKINKKQKARWKEQKKENAANAEFRTQTVIDIADLKKSIAQLVKSQEGLSARLESLDQKMFWLMVTIIGGGFAFAVAAIGAYLAN